MTEPHDDNAARQELRLLLEANEHLAIALQQGLQHYSMTLDLLANYINTGKRSYRTKLHQYGLQFGRDIMVMTLVIDALRDHWQPSDKGRAIYAPVALPLATRLGGSYISLLSIDSVEIAKRCPVIDMERTFELFTPAVQEWMAAHVDEVPQYQTIR